MKYIKGYFGSAFTTLVVTFAEYLTVVMRMEHLDRTVDVAANVALTVVLCAALAALLYCARQIPLLLPDHTPKNWQISRALIRLTMRNFTAILVGLVVVDILAMWMHYL